VIFLCVFEDLVDEVMCRLTICEERGFRYCAGAGGSSTSPKVVFSLPVLFT
jgi:hypothetical protein